MVDKVLHVSVHCRMEKLYHQGLCLCIALIHWLLLLVPQAQPTAWVCWEGLLMTLQPYIGVIIAGPSGVSYPSRVHESQEVFRL
jgi:hypothetical protein